MQGIFDVWIALSLVSQRAGFAMARKQSRVVRQLHDPPYRSDQRVRVTVGKIGAAHRAADNQIAAYQNFFLGKMIGVSDQKRSLSDIPNIVADVEGLWFSAVNAALWNLQRRAS